MTDIPVQDTNIITLAAIDVGTNTVRLLVVRGEDPVSATILDQAQQITRLGEGMGRVLQDGPIRRTVAAISGFVARAREFRPDHVAIFTTSAARRAENGEEFCRSVYDATGVDVEIISGEYEALLTVNGVLGAVPSAGRDSVILDIGGGSTELVKVVDGKVMSIQSLEVGAVSLTERFFHPADPIPDADLRSMREFSEQAIDGLDFPGHTTWVGTAGTITTLAALDMQMVQYAPHKINGHVLSVRNISRRLGELASMSLQERKKLAGLEPDRADIIVAGAAFLEVIMKHYELESITVSDGGFREGIIYELFERHK